jgi:asparagine synthase (glutamine-hydrolysing)
MCGIAGYFGQPSATDFTDRALRMLASRGPDGNGVWRNAAGSVSLVHTRLAIIDLSEAGRQPMEFRRSEIGDQRLEGGEQREDGDAISNLSSGMFQPKSASTVLVFNGEIYNYRELRAELETQGEVFSGGSDTEVLLRLLVREGEKCLPKLAGMFAFAFWDEATGEGLLARDTLGIKPLYYRHEAGALGFSSDARVLRERDDQLDSTALRNYFLWGSVADSQSLHREVRQLPAGHLLRWRNGGIAIENWDTTRFGKASLTENGLRRAWRGLSAPALVTRVALEECVNRHLVSDVPVGIFLSGGIDSTALLAIARDLLGKEADILTFSIGFDDPEYDESDLARRTADHFGTRHTEWRMTAEDGAAEIPAYLAALDQPTIDGFNTWCVSKLASREGVKVVLSGLGGDEVFAGYGSFDLIPKFRAWHRRLGPLRRLAASVLRTRPVGTPWQRLADFFNGNGSWLEAYHAQRGIFTLDEAAALAAALGGEAASSPDWQLAGLVGDDREIVSHLELTLYMRNQLLRDSDVFSMAHGLELRVPFVDQRLLNTVKQLPAVERLRQGKLLLIDSVPELPEWIRSQPKRGFRFPFQTWIQENHRDMLAHAERISPVPLVTWYRTWAVAAAIQTLSKPKLMGRA